MDMDPNCGADVLHDVDETPWPFEDGAFDEVHAYEVLEHVGQQGDWRAFFRHFGEIYRVLRHGGALFGTVPWWQSEWAWGDPSHTRVLTPGTFLFLDQRQYAERVGTNAMTDFRHTWRGDFEIVGLSRLGEDQMAFALKAHKPARIYGNQDKG